MSGKVGQVVSVPDFESQDSGCESCYSSHGFIAESVSLSLYQSSALDKVSSNWVFWAIFTHPFLIEMGIRIFSLGTLLC